MDKIVSFSMSGMCHSQNCLFHHVWNMVFSKLFVSACLECVSISMSRRLEYAIVKIVAPVKNVHMKIKDFLLLDQQVSDSTSNRYTKRSETKSVSNGNLLQVTR
jgi:hypothetical protein